MMDFAGGGLGPTQCCADVQGERGHAEGDGPLCDEGVEVEYCPAGGVASHEGCTVQVAQGAGHDNPGSAVEAGHGDN